MPAPHPRRSAHSARSSSLVRSRAGRQDREGSRISESCLRNWMAQADADLRRSRPMALISWHCASASALLRSSRRSKSNRTTGPGKRS
jgi:hypothetical protein